MDYQLFINQQVVDYQGQTGVVVSFDKEHIVIQQNKEQTTYNPDIAFKNEAIRFVESRLNNLIKEDIESRHNAATAHQQKIDKINKEAIKRNKMASDKYIELEKKDKVLKRLFGNDFVYPPFALLKKKFPHAKRKKEWYEIMLEDISGTVSKTY